MSKNVWQSILGWYQRCQRTVLINLVKLQVLTQRLSLLQSKAKSIDRKSLCIIIGLASTAFWLYYELGYVAPFCPYYSGTELPPYLNRFKTIGKTYRPTFYMFAPYFQWIYLICFSRLMLAYHWLQYGATESRSKLAAMGYKVATYIFKLVFKTFLFRKMYRNQAVVAIREIVEASNDAVVVLDYYLPKWAGTYCSKCGKFKPESHKDESSQTSNKYNQNSHNSGDETKDLNARNNPIFRDNLRGQEYKSGPSPYQTYAGKPHQTREQTMGFTSEATSAMSGGASRLVGQDDNSEDNSHASRYHTVGSHNPVDQSELPPRKILRGLLVLICDTGVSYSICDQPISCRCGGNMDRNTDSMCVGCVKSMERDSKGLNPGTPASPAVRYIIGDALEIGYACVQVHLNVNLGMANEAFPSWTGLRCFPISLYSDVVLDLEAALKKVSERYPHLPMNCIGFGYGANILMEYLAIGSAGKPIQLYNGSTKAPHKGIGSISEERSFTQSQDQLTESFQSHESKGEKEQVSNNKGPPTTCAVSLGYNFASSGSENPVGHPNKERLNDYRNNPVANTLASLDRNHPNYESFCRLSEVMEQVASARGSRDLTYHGNPRSNSLVNPKEGYFVFGEESEECTYETRWAYPPPQPSEVMLNVKRISTAVCVNLNLRPGGNALYNHAGQRKLHRRNFYGRYCFSSFRYQLTNLLREVHCRRAGDFIQKECYHYRCCHFTQAVKKQNWLKSLLFRLKDFSKGFEKATRYHGVEQMLLNIHQEYRQSYRQMKRKTSIGHVNYASGIYKRFGARAAADFKFAALMTLRYVYTQVGQDSRSRVETLSGPATYKLVNRRIKTSLHIGRAKAHSGISNLLNHPHRRHQGSNIYKYLADLINREYNKNVTNIRRNFTSIELPTLVINSLDNSVCNLEDIDILDVIKNPNIVYYIAKSGGYSTFLSGTHPASALSVPILEFMDEMTSKRVLL